MTNEKVRDPLLAQYEVSRPQLRALAYRMLSSLSEADDALQEVWLRLSRVDTTSVENLPGWLTTVTGRICLDMLRSRKARRESLDSDTDADADAMAGAPDTDRASPEQDTLLADSLNLALLVVLDTLTPTERLAFVLHDLFDLPFAEIAEICDCSPMAARQLASRARRRVRGGSASPLTVEADSARQRDVVRAFLRASRTGDLAGLLAVLDPEVVLRCDRTAVEESLARRAQGAPEFQAETRGAAAVAATFVGRAQAAEVALIDGEAGAIWAPGGEPRAAFSMTIVGGRIAAIDLVADPDELGSLDIERFTNS